MGNEIQQRKLGIFLAHRYVQTIFAKKYKLEEDIRALQQQLGQSVSDFHSSMCIILDQLELINLN